MEGSSVLNIDSRRELFVDHYLIGKLTNTTLKLHEPRNEGGALQMDKPWEAPYPDYVSVVKDGDLYRMWFRGRYGESGRRLVPARSERVPCCVFSRHPAHRSSRRRP